MVNVNAVNCCLVNCFECWFCRGGAVIASGNRLPPTEPKVRPCSCRKQTERASPFPTYCHSERAKRVEESLEIPRHDVPRNDREALYR